MVGTDPSKGESYYFWEKTAHKTINIEENVRQNLFFGFNYNQVKDDDCAYVNMFLDRGEK